VDGSAPQDFPVASQKPQAMSTLIFTINQVTAGQHELLFILDVFNRVDDKDRNNNTKNVYFTVSSEGIVSLLTP
jgi:subtilase family serine protease